MRLLVIEGNLVYLHNSGYDLPNNGASSGSGFPVSPDKRFHDETQNNRAPNPDARRNQRNHHLRREQLMNECIN